MKKICFMRERDLRARGDIAQEDLFYFIERGKN